MCECGVCALLAECRPTRPAQQVEQIVDKPMLQRLHKATSEPLPALSPMHMLYRSKSWGNTTFRNTLKPGEWR